MCPAAPSAVHRQQPAYAESQRVTAYVGVVPVRDTAHAAGRESGQDLQPARQPVDETNAVDAHLTLFPLEDGWSWVQGVKVALVGRNQQGTPTSREGRTGLDGGITFADLAPGAYRILLADDVWACTWEALHHALAQAIRGGMDEEVGITEDLFRLRCVRRTTGDSGTLAIALQPYAASLVGTAFPVTVEDPETGHTYTGSVLGDGEFHTLEVVSEEQGEMELAMAAQAMEEDVPSLQPEPKTYQLSDPRVLAILEEGESGRAELTLQTTAPAFAKARVRFTLGGSTGELVLQPTDPPGAWSDYRVLSQTFAELVDLQPVFVLLPPQREGRRDDDV